MAVAVAIKAVKKRRVRFSEFEIQRCLPAAGWCPLTGFESSLAHPHPRPLLNTSIPLISFLKSIFYSLTSKFIWYIHFFLFFFCLYGTSAHALKSLECLLLLPSNPQCPLHLLCIARRDTSLGLLGGEEGQMVFIPMMRLSARRDQIPTPMKMTSRPLSIQIQIRRPSPPPRMYHRMVTPLCSAPALRRPSSMGMGAKMVTITHHCLRPRWTGQRWSRMKWPTVPPNFLSSTSPTLTKILSTPRPLARLYNAGPPSRSARPPVVAPLNQCHPLRYPNHHPNHPSPLLRPRCPSHTLNQRLLLHHHLTAVGKRRGKHIKSG